MSDSTNPPTKPKRRWPVVSIAVLMALCMVSVAVVGPATQEAEAVVPIVVIGGALAIGAIAGWIANDILTQGQHGNAEAAIQANKETYVSAIKTNFDTAFAFADNWAESMTANYEADQLLITRKAEYMARELYLYQTANDLPYNYNPEWVFQHVGSSDGQSVGHYLVSMLESSHAMYTAAFKTLENVPSTFVGDFAGMQLTMGGYRQTYGDQYVTYKVDASNPNIKFMTMPQLSLSVDRYALLTPGQEILAVSKAPGTYNLGLVNDQGTVVHEWNTNNTYSGQMTWLTIPDDIDPSSKYRFSGSDYYLFGYALPSLIDGMTIGQTNLICYENVNGINCINAIMRNTGASDVYTICSVGRDVALKDYGGSSIYGELSVYKSTSYPYSTQTVIWSCGYHKLPHLDDFYSKLQSMRTVANVAANSYYNLLVETGDDQRYESMPDFLFPDPSQMEGLTVEEMYALLLVYRQQMADYYQNAAYMGLGNATFSPNSLGLYVRGALYNADGTQIYDNQTIWTPYVNVASQMLVAGDNVSFPHSMTVVKWGESPTIGAFLESEASTANMRWTYPGPGAYAIVEEMFHNGTPINDIELHLSTYEVLAPEIPDPLPPGQSGLGTSAIVNWMVDNWYWITVGIGAVTVIAAALLRNSAVAGVGLLIILAGLAGYAATEVLPEWWESVKPWIISQDFWRPGP